MINHDKISTLMSKLDEKEIQQIYDNYSSDLDEFNHILDWVKNKQEQCNAVVTRIPLKETLDGIWKSDIDSGNIKHVSGGFFEIIGVDIKTDIRESGKGWKQPMIDQGTESSIAGFIRKRINNKYLYLIEAKFEPGNYGRVLISPTLQVTYSNLKQQHGGKRPRYAEYFDESLPFARIDYSQWLPEDGGRFFLKRVKYMIVTITNENDIEFSENFKWVSLNTLKKLMHRDNLVNPHVRSLLAVL